MDFPHPVDGAAPSSSRSALAVSQGFARHRVETLTDGIYAVAMTLLVLEVKLPDAPLALAHSHGLVAWVNDHLLELLPRFFAWILSFLILSIFWVAHQRVFQHVAYVPAKLLWLNIAMLLGASLLPFSSSLVGQHVEAFASTAFYAANLIALSLLSLAQWRYLSTHPEICSHPVAPAERRASVWRLSALIVTALAALILAWHDPRFGPMAFLLMPLAARLSRRLAHDAPPPRAAAPRAPRDQQARQELAHRSQRGPITARRSKAFGKRAP